MIEEVFRIGDFAISPFGLTLVVAFIAAYLQLRWGFERNGAGDEEDASAIVFAAGLAGIAGGKIYYAILYGDWHLLYDRAGLVWYGSFIGGFLAVSWVMRKRRLGAWPVLDAVGPSLALAYGIGRVGCFLVGDDYGRPTDLPWGMVFKKGLPPTTAGNLSDYFGIAVPEGTSPASWVAVHPTQLYETGIALVIWGIGLWLFRKRLPAGMCFSIVLALLACERIVVETLRAKDDRFFGIFTLAQLISLVVLVGALSALSLLSKRRGAGGAEPSV